jgi:hypothetical protein
LCLGAGRFVNARGWLRISGETSAVAQTQGFPRGVSCPAAVDSKRVAVDEAALLRVGEKGDGCGDIVRGSEASHGNAARNISVRVASTRLIGCIHFGFHPTGTDGVDAKAAPAPFSSKSARQADEAVF